MVLVIACSLGGLGCWIIASQESQIESQRSYESAIIKSQSDGWPAAFKSNQENVPLITVPVVAVPDNVGSAPDLKWVFDENIDSADPRQRRIAARAFNTCVPTFLAGDGEIPSPDPLIQALPHDFRAERETAYRLLYGRCQRFLNEDRASLLVLQQHLQADRTLQDPGLVAQEDLVAGRYERSESLVSLALASGDPASVASLAGLATRLAIIRNPDASDSDLMQRARDVDAALPLVACDLGLDCSANSLGALQLCAVQGFCEGDMFSRIMVDVIDPAAVQMQRTRLLALIRSRLLIGTADLLP